MYFCSLLDKIGAELSVNTHLATEKLPDGYSVIIHGVLAKPVFMLPRDQLLTNCRARDSSHL